MSETLSKDALKSLCAIATKGIMDGMAHSYLIITQEIWEELERHDMVTLAPGNDGDRPWDGKVSLSVDLGAKLCHHLLLALTDFLLEVQNEH